MTPDEHYEQAEFWLRASLEAEGRTRKGGDRKLKLLQERALIHAILATCNRKGT